ncbi:FUSC family protein [Bordetella sp. H567]|uniref:FUSC family protein n=1 Tax=Bordetella sp. H567 TaxID=1697043 RepID=UPI0011AB6495|nr:FUSC family protein [Bordetella sp. H567]
MRPAWIVSFSIADANFSDGLRAACASTAMLVAGYLLHDTPLFAWAAIGAFWTCLADAPASRAHRLASMAGFSLLSAILGGVTAFASGWGTLPALGVIMVFSLAAGLSSIYSASVYQVAILVATACVVMADHPLYGAIDGVPFLATYFIGCAFATGLSFTVWRIHPLAPARRAAGLVYSSLSELARDNGRLLRAVDVDRAQWAAHASELRSLTRRTIEGARKALCLVPMSRRGDGGGYADLCMAASHAERIFDYLIAVAHAAEYAVTDRRTRRRAARALTAMAEVLGRIGHALEHGPAPYPKPMRERLAGLSTHVRGLVQRPLVFDAADIDMPWPATAEESPLKTVRQVLQAAIVVLRENMTPSSAGLRHAARLAVVVGMAFVAVRALKLPFGYWATMATLLVLQPSVGSTWPRSLDRAVGSIIGAVIAAALGVVVHTPLALSLVVFPLICLTMALRKVGYILYVIFLTPTFVLVTDLASPANELLYSATRLGNNILGVVLALLGTYLLWPKRDADYLPDALADAVAANLQYLRLSLYAGKVSHAECEAARRAAGLASNRLEQTYKLARLEQLKLISQDRQTAEIAALLRGIAGAASQARLLPGDALPDGEFVSWVDLTVDAVLLARSRGTDHAASAGLVERLPAPSVEGRTALESVVATQLTQLSALLTKRFSAIGTPSKSSRAPA